MTRGNTRQRIQDVALELFVSKGYEHASLREIADHLGVTKAALYYHFRTKEDILRAIAEDMIAPVDELLEWGREQPRTAETRAEVLRRYAEALNAAKPFFRFMHDNHAAVREMEIFTGYKDRVGAVMDLLQPPEGGLLDAARASATLFSLHGGLMSLQERPEPEDAKYKARLQVALEIAEHIGG
jgi:AcrR family transcriptional regulator